MREEKNASDVKQVGVLIVGATSAIATAVGKIYASRNSAMFLVGRNEEKLTSLSEQFLQLGAARVGVFVTDLNNKASHDVMIETAVERLGDIEVALIAQGSMPSKTGLEMEVDEVLDSMVTNTLSVVSVAHRVATVMRNQGKGSLVVLSSVAGERGRRSNYVYGSSKAALTAYCSGLRAEMAAHNVNVLTVKPGVVDTPMTQDKKVPLKANVDGVAKDIVRATDQRRKTLYTPWFWRWIMLVVRNIPEWLFMKIKS